MSAHIESQYRSDHPLDGITTDEIFQRLQAAQQAIRDCIDAAEFASDDLQAEIVELTVLMPCLNEAETLATCISKAFDAMREHKIAGEVIVADNGSTDGFDRNCHGVGRPGRPR